MRSEACICLAVVLFGILVIPTNAQAQPLSTHDITLYAHSDGNFRILNASAPVGTSRYVNVNKTITFTLSPVLGKSLQIHGSITYTVNLNASVRSSGTVSTWLSELKSTGELVQVTGANTSTMVALENRTQTIPLGIGPIDYEFQRGSVIQLNIRVLVPRSSAIPYLVWDEAANPSGLTPLVPTSVKIPAADPTQTEPKLCPNLLHSGPIIEWSPTSVCTVSANVTDAFGIYRLSISVTLAGQNTTILIQPTNISTYSWIASTNTTLLPGSWHAVLRILDSSGNTDTFDYEFWAARFYPVLIRVVDQSNNSLTDAYVKVNYEDVNLVNETDSKGQVTIRLPESDLVGPLNLTVTWHNATTNLQLTVPVNSFLVRMPLYNFGLRLLLGGVIPLSNIRVELPQAKVETGLDGVAYFKQIPEGNYTLHIDYLFNSTQFETKLEVNPTINGNIVTVDVPIPAWITYLTLILAFIIATSILTIFIRRRSKLYPNDFSYLNDLTGGGLPKTCFAVVAGNAGSGKSVMLESLAAQHLIEGHGAVYIVNTEYPSSVREHMTATLNMPPDLANKSNLLFIDSYSAISGTASAERFHISSETDLTSLGMEVSKCLTELGPAADIYVDSVTPMLADLRVDYILRFFQAIAGKVKANGGKLCVTIGSGVDKSDMTKFEEISDCIIETQIQELKKGQRRRLRVKKLRGKPYNDRWTRFQIENGKGIVFLTPRNVRTDSP